MSLLLALALAVAPGCPEALAAARAATDGDLAERADALVSALADAGAGPTGGVAGAAAALAAAEEGAARTAAAAAFRGALTRHCDLAAAPPAAEATAADRAVLAEILARPELSQARLDPWAIRRALLRFWDWITELLGTQEAERYASLGRALFLGAAAAAAALALGAVRRRRRAAGPRAPGPGAPPRSGLEQDRSAQRAEEALRRGEAREAVRHALLSALAALERAGRIPRGRAFTNEELVRALTPAASIPTSADLALLARAFDRAVYGGRTVELGEARLAVERARRVAAAAGGAP